MAQHVNLYGYGNETEVYAGFKRDYKRDAGQGHIFDIVAILAVIWLVQDWQPRDIIAAVALFWGFSGGIRTFIDNSNRNFFLHSVDAKNARRQAAASQQSSY